MTGGVSAPEPMRPNPAFRSETGDRNLAFARQRGFGTLAVGTDGGPLLSHIPFLLDEAGDAADLHLVRSNPILRRLGTPQPAVIAVMGPDGYVSPDWYGVDDQVPTWNYVAVHLRGVLERLPQEAMRDMLDRQSAGFEERLLPKPPWMPGKMTPEVLDRMMRQIVPCRMTVETVEGTWKLNQNKMPDARRRAADGIEAAGLGGDTGDLASLMRSVPEE